MVTSSRILFGTTPAGTPVEQLTLDNGILSCDLLTFGATLRSLHTKNREGTPIDVVLGYDSLQEYQTQDGYLGAVVGRYANRIANGTFSLHGTRYTLATNNGTNHLHGGKIGFSHRVFSVTSLTSTCAVLSLVSPDGEEGYPGTLHLTVTYTLEGQTLSIRYHATSDQDTICNLTNHAYFNLNGHNSGSILDQTVVLYADQYTPTNADNIPLGSIAPVAGTPMDLRNPTPLHTKICTPFEQLIQGHGFDHNYIIHGTTGTLRPAAHTFCPQSGITMDVATTMPALQFYTANYLEQGCRGKGNCLYAPRHGFCLETQFYPDSPNHPSFPSPVLPAGSSYDHETRFTFSTLE